MGDRVVHGKATASSRRRFLRFGATAAVGVAAGGLPVLAMARRPESAPHANHESLQVFVNNVGYEAHGPKRLVLGGGPSGGSAPLPFRVVDTTSGAVVHHGTADFAGPIDDWAEHASPDVPGVYWTGDFTELTRPGQYVVAVDAPLGALPSVSCPFLVETDLYARRTMSPVLHYFKGSRCSGQFDKWDTRLPVGKGGKERVDVHGGWYDATADYGIHFGQAFPRAPQFLTTTQTPLLAWVLFACHAQIRRRRNEQFAVIGEWLLDEAMFGADFLVRMHPEHGSFYSSINQPEPGKPDRKLGYEPYDLRHLEAKNGVPVLASFRLGGGSAVAALAAASTFKVSGDHDNPRYLETAVQAFRYLRENNRQLNRGTPDNILDDSERLLAATELFKATGDRAYADVARDGARHLAGRLGSWRHYRNYWRAGDGDEPFFNASNEGLPPVCLANYLDIAEPVERAQLVDVLQKALTFHLEISRQVVNPFGYAREFVQDAAGRRYTSFFYPHDVTPSTQGGGWWQGENARIASLATAARLVAQHGSSGLAEELERYATDQLSWICGLNPYGSCMLDGVGLNGPAYFDADGTWQFLHQAGGIVNGITGSTVAGGGIEYEKGYPSGGFVADWPNDWRHMEQWLPHSTWFLYATSIGEARAAGA